TDFNFPALLPFPDRSNLLIEAPRDGRAAAVGLLQAAMLRLLTTLPPGQVRFTIIDPVGIGRNFGAFMHLADIDEALVTNQVWTEPRQIEERLADLSAHMEKVTQKYLRNEYATLGEYNSVAGEVAEPYRVLVIADFPANFDDKAAARLAAIASSGVSCGVLTLIAVDPDRPLPAGITLDDLRPNAVPFHWDGARLVWGDPDFGAFPLSVDTPPPAGDANRLIHRAGTASRDAKRVEVSFEFIAPPDDGWWTRDSRTGIDIPLGKSGATKRQHLTLGHGTSQHVLIAGRTGSGKSTLMHALITNLALNYSPDMVDLYLIDFKKGVEFKVYATNELPHASVVAIESEREFGVSVLMRLDDEMRVRGERFRDAGVQDLNGYRNSPGAAPLPRVLLIVDEFQEFFVEDDKVAQEAARLLDRLVRQGRAFGVHILLGSQSLGGAQTLPRTTLGQMAVRVALQCSEADAHLILAENNTAAKLLSRPGEAVYNDANGAPEGNHFFQVVWLGDDRREAYLERLTEMARERPPILTRTPIVFEGDAPADLSRNPQLSAALNAPGWPASPRSALAWLGDPVAIREATGALFRRQGGNHLLIVGQNSEAALGVMTSALLSLAAQFPPAASDTVRAGARFAVLDGTPEDESRAEYLGNLARTLPHPVMTGGWNDTARVLGELAREVARRQEPEADGPEVFLFVNDLARFRDLRRKADDFSFSRRDDEDATPADQLGTILREGPGLGVHVILWCDSVNNLNRSFDHQALREFEMRVLFQMSQTDSGHLLDAPHASKLGNNRALFYSEEQNRLEKFRPYGLPSDALMERVRTQLAGRGPVDGIA
ncbi:MAG TPA: FtsK/SpoIIIE domain-containing protein, partial [Isosphaeraceae bacterium]|nr:FtsK/SpoIIIE domain-containing protein [Isosphaeraceae bacterium]